MASGSDRSGFGHWWSQRLSAVLLVPLGLWFAFTALGLPVTNHAAIATWVHEPLHAIPLILLLVILLYHSALGVQVVIEDYVHHVPTRTVALALGYFAHIALAIAGIYAVVMLSFGGQP